MTRHIVKVDLELQRTCLQSLRIGSGLLLVKSIESVFISTLRAFETYGSTVRISICSRTAILASAIVLTEYGRNVVWIMVATLLISTSGTLAQALALKSKIGSFSPMPSWHRKTVSDIAAFGTFSWLQAIAGVAFSHADRFFVGFFMGAPGRCILRSLCSGSATYPRSDLFRNALPVSSSQCSLFRCAAFRDTT